MALRPTVLPRIGWLAIFAIAGCGGFENDPLTTGVVRGRLKDFDSSALVAAAPEGESLFHRATLHADGSFELQGLRPGDYSLFVVAKADKVLKVRATVRSGSVADLGSLEPRPGAFIDARLSQPSLAATALVTVLETPYADQKFALSSGRVAIGPLPEGRYELVARANDTETHWASYVAEGARTSETVEFGSPPNGCLAAGASCPPGLVCGSDGNCVACLQSSDCAAGLACVGNACVGTPNACACCSSDGQCGARNACLAVDERHAICIAACDAGEACGSGFVCHYGLCIPGSDEVCEEHDDD
jgi:hypothetical protein